MKLSKRGFYGLKAIIYIAEVSITSQTERQLVQIKEIAEHEQIPGKYLEQILLSMKNAGLLNSKMGAGGGYYLARPADKILLSEVVRLLEGPLAPVRCVSNMAYEPCGCVDEASCGLRLVMKDVRDAIAAVLENVSLADVVARSAIIRQQRRQD